MKISMSEQYVLGKLNTAGIDPFKTGMYFLMKKLKKYELLVVIKADNSGIVSIEEADKYDIAEAPESSPMRLVFPGPAYVAMMPKYNLHINIEKR